MFYKKKYNFKEVKKNFPKIIFLKYKNFKRNPKIKKFNIHIQK